MDVERTIQSIVRRQVRHEAWVEAMEKRLDRRMDAITKLLHQGMRMLVQLDARVNDLAKSQAELAEAQKATERTLQAFMKSLRNGRNGH